MSETDFDWVVKRHGLENTEENRVAWERLDELRASNPDLVMEWIVWHTNLDIEYGHTPVIDWD